MARESVLERRLAGAPIADEPHHERQHELGRGVDNLANQLLHTSSHDDKPWFVTVSKIPLSAARAVDYTTHTQTSGREDDLP